MIFRSPHPEVEIPDQSFSEYLFPDLEKRRDRAALIEGGTGRTVTYGELVDLSTAVALGLIARGIEPGDVVAICSPNVPEYAIAFHGIAMCGACSTTLNPLQTVEEISHQIADSGARLFVTIPPLLEKALAVAGRTEIEDVFVFGDVEEGQDATNFSELVDAGHRARQTAAAVGGHDPLETLGDLVADSAETVVTLPYSSGTTGKPKGVMLTHRNLVANIEQYLLADPVEEDEVVIAVLPFFHIYGMVVVMSACLRAGATLVTLPRFDLEQFLGTIQEHRVTRAYLVPPIILALAKHPLIDDYDLSSLEYVTSGAAPLGAEVALSCQNRLGVRVSQGYGLTEASPVTHLRPLTDPGTERIGTVGPCLSNTEVCVVDLDSGARLGPGGEGEVWIRGPQIMKGYLNNPEATAATVDRDGWLHTGDVGCVDEDGFLTIVDRAKELIKYKGYQVPPAELEDLLLSHPSVADAAVIPSPDEESGEVPKAFVVSSGEVTEDEIMAFVAERVAPYKKIRLVEFIDEVPKSPSGKILRRILVQREREAAAARRG
ncbi:MAG: 4-coumarate--CoA ligase family protein [Gemmatimonadota bacterium]|nr:4-coumarate--CoA ligase family protein [Gemmatimonadota bacterium]